MPLSIGHVQRIPMAGYMLGISGKKHSYSAFGDWIRIIWGRVRRIRRCGGRCMRGVHISEGVGGDTAFCLRERDFLPSIGAAAQSAECSQDPPSVGRNDPLPLQERHFSELPDVDFGNLYVKCPMLPTDERVTLLRPHEITAYRKRRMTRTAPYHE